MGVKSAGRKITLSDGIRYTGCFTIKENCLSTTEQLIVVKSSNSKIKHAGEILSLMVN